MRNKKLKKNNEEKLLSGKRKIGAIPFSFSNWTEIILWQIDSYFLLQVQFLYESVHFSLSSKLLVCQTQINTCCCNGIQQKQQRVFFPPFFLLNYLFAQVFFFFFLYLALVKNIFIQYIFGSKCLVDTSYFDSKSHSLNKRICRTRCKEMPIKKKKKKI